MSYSKNAVPQWTHSGVEEIEYIHIKFDNVVPLKDGRNELMIMCDMSYMFLNETDDRITNEMK